ncbi:hypothetical protein A5828_001557, partial [Enterococcus faecium]
CELVVVNFILQKGLPFLYGFFHLHKIFYTLFQFLTYKNATLINNDSFIKYTFN